jgi:hypothetical protein
MLPIVFVLASCAPAQPIPPSSASTTTAPTVAATPSKDLPESACPEPMYDPNVVTGPKTDVRIELHDATGEKLALTEFCILLDGRSVFSKAQMKQAIEDGGKGTVAWTSPIPTTEKHKLEIMVAMTGAGSAEISKLKLKLRGERSFNAKAGLVLKIETIEEGDPKAPIDTRAALHVSPIDP